MDFSKAFSKYEILVGQVGDVFTNVSDQFPSEVACKPGCDDCCHALFDLTLVEALYVKNKFDELFTGKERYTITEKANIADRVLAKLKKEAYKRHEAGDSDESILETVSKTRVRCPLLGEENKCVMYDARPIACRVYGIPTSAGGKGHTCGISGFKEGTAYPTLNMDVVYKKLYAISHELIRDINSKYTKMDSVLVPLSMALLTDYHEEYLGVESAEASE